ncbi:MAG: L-serine ammonia-lyase [Bacteroidota bacterium]
MTPDHRPPPKQALSVFDMLKVGVGPSSSHTLGPWRAIQRWLRELDDDIGLATVERVEVRLYGSLALTGRGHCTDQAIMLALLGFDPETIPVEQIPALIADLSLARQLELAPGKSIPFAPDSDIVYVPSERLPGHANGMICRAETISDATEATYYSIGGGFVIREGDGPTRASSVELPYPAQVPKELLTHCASTGLRIADVVRANERAWSTPEEVRDRLLTIWSVMQDGIFRGCHTDGVLPGGLNVQRRAAALSRQLLDGHDATTSEAWISEIRSLSFSFKQVLKWVSAFAMAVNEENANLGRVVTAPTNGAAGVIPAVLMYHLCFGDEEPSDQTILDFLLVAGEVGTFFKKGATISAAMGGCQAEIGVSSAMAAAALAEALGGTPAQAFTAAEIAMEHHLGMTCDPIGGLVQVPCIERNTMGAIKAINAAELAVSSDPASAKVTLDEVIQTLRETAENMSDKYKETSQGGLAVNVSVRVPEC